MTFIPIIERELRGRARRPATYWMRFAVALLGTLMCLMQLAASSAVGGAARAGNASFQALLVAAFALCCSACLLTADTISSERREGTLGLLFLTHVTGPDVLLGKLASAALAGLCVVLAFLPVMMLPLLAGGVTGGEVLRKCVVLLETLFLALTVGLWASARGEAWLPTVRRAVLLMLGLLIVSLVYGWLTRSWREWSFAVAAFSPITALTAASDANYRATPTLYWESLFAMLLLAGALLWRAGVLLRRSLSEPPIESSNSPTSADADKAQPISRRRAQPLTDQTEPLHWLLARQRGVWAAVWVGVLLVAGNFFFYPYLIRFIGSGVALQTALWPTSMILSVARGALFAWVASRFFVESRRTGELELLATTPCGAATLVTAQWAMLKRVFRWPIVVILLLVFLRAVPVLLMRSGLPAGFWKGHYFATTCLSGINTCLQVFALCWVAMWFGLTASNQKSAIAWSVGLVVFLPSLLLWGVSLSLNVLARILINAGTPFNFTFVSWATNLLLLAYLLWLIYRASRLLSGNLRVAELQPLGLARGWREFWSDGANAIRKARHWTPA